MAYFTPNMLSAPNNAEVDRGQLQQFDAKYFLFQVKRLPTWLNLTDLYSSHAVRDRANVWIKGRVCTSLSAEEEKHTVEIVPNDKINFADANTTVEFGSRSTCEFHDFFPISVMY